jgi:hypothetical protein
MKIIKAELGPPTASWGSYDGQIKDILPNVVNSLLGKPLTGVEGTESSHILRFGDSFIEFYKGGSIKYFVKH